jgi:uncharacterized protein with PIN domain
MYHFSVLLSFSKERVQAVVGVDRDVQMWTESTRCTRCLARFWGDLYWRTISSDMTECTNSIRSACTKEEQHHAMLEAGRMAKAGLERVFSYGHV